MRRTNYNRAISLAVYAAFALAGCGTYVPAIQEIGDDNQGLQLVHAIIDSVHCEMRNAVSQIYWDDVKASGPNKRRMTDFFDSWGALVQLQLTVEEKTTLNPIANWAPNKIFSVVGSATGTTDATRIDKLNYFYRVSDLAIGGCPTGAPDTPHQPASPLIQSDLKLYNWLSTLMYGRASGDITALGKENALTHEAKFEVVTTGSLAPAWKLSRVFSVDPNGSLFSATRDRTHDLLITFGPIADDKIQVLAPTAQNAFVTSSINLSARTGSSP